MECCLYCEKQLKSDKWTSGGEVEWLMEEKLDGGVAGGGEVK